MGAIGSDAAIVMVVGHFVAPMARTRRYPVHHTAVPPLRAHTLVTRDVSPGGRSISTRATVNKEPAFGRHRPS